MKLLLFLGLTLFVNEIIVSQVLKDDLYLTDEHNTEWIKEFEKLNLVSDQIVKIKRKVFEDTVYKRQRSYCLTGVKKAEVLKRTVGKTNFECKIMFILSLQGDLYILDLNESPKTNRVLELINNKNIDGVTVLKKGAIALALYGAYGKCGVVMLYSDSQRLKRKVKSIF
ncbi:hypothetical protein [uncultured Dokdonia sp.]|uniref:hypothetical protein n=1 Tax=uncultured Dokdonia sp. TaxID=575653 RepID=UPI00261FB5BF|nr:hypothetical protein [uncultured Dokdonia sp.]